MKKSSQQLDGLSERDLDKIRHHIEDREGLYLGGWGIHDLIERYLITEEKARESFAEHEMALSEASCTMGGWPSIEEYCNYPELDDCEEKLRTQSPRY